MPGRPSPTPPLVCPNCGSVHEAQERLCPRCGMPLVLDPQSAGQPPVGPRHQQLRKIKPQLADGRLVRVAGARNQAEAEFIQALLLEEGVPSLVQRAAGFDVPDFLAAGPRDVLVPEAGATTAHEVLLDAELVGPERPAGVAPARLLVGLLLALALGALAVWLVGFVLGG